jgi:hypothetical protein
MGNTLGSLMVRNLLEVFGQRDSAQRAAAIAELYTADCTFFEAEEQVTGREALNAKVGSILKGAPGFVFRAVGPAQVNHDLGRLRWQLGPAGAPPVVAGMDIAVFARGRIRALYTFLDESVRNRGHSGGTQAPELFKSCRLGNFSMFAAGGSLTRSGRIFQ